MKKVLPNYLIYLFKVYFLGVWVLSFLRLLELYLNWDLTHSIDPDLKIDYFIKTIILGVRFDTLIMVYFLALPFLVLFINDLFFKNNVKVLRVVKVMVFVLFSLLFFVGGADIPYFGHFNYRLTSAALMWMDNPAFVFGMIFQEPSYWGILIPVIVLIYFFFKLNKGFLENSFHETQSLKVAHKLLAFLGIGLLLFFGLRGRFDLDESPLGPVDAYYSDYSVMNQMALNPAFTFLKSILDKSKKSNRDLNLMDDNIAIQKVQHYLNREGNEYSPISKQVIPDSSLEEQPNVVLILMEGLSAVRMKAFGSTDNCTPFLDSLAKESIFFKNIYSAGIHTHNGVFGALTSHPALFERHAMKQIPIPKYNSLPRVLQNHGYSTIYFTNHDVEFDNVGGFLTENGIEKLVSDRNYPPEKVLSSMGVADGYMFNYAMPFLNDLGNQGNPFLSVFMTTSNHKPYVFPEGYQKRFEDDELNAYAYADESLKNFMEEARKQDWFENTIFVLIADHGWAITPQYDLSLNHCHVPLLFYSPKYIPEASVEMKMGGQIDVFPSIMGLLKLPYENTTLGIDLFKDSRPYIFFNGDTRMGVIDGRYLYIYRINGPESLHEYSAAENLLSSMPEKVDSMKNYGFANMQVADYLRRNNRVGASNQKN